MQPRPMRIARQHELLADAKGKGDSASERFGRYDITSRRTRLCRIDNRLKDKGELSWTHFTHSMTRPPDGPPRPQIPQLCIETRGYRFDDNPAGRL